MNVHISICFCMDFCHANLCTNEYPYYSCMGFCHAHLCINDYHILMGFHHAHFCTNEYLFLCIRVFVMQISVRMTIHIIFEWVFVMHITVRMNIHFFVYGFSSCTFLYKWLSISLCIGFFHAHFCTNDYPFLCVWDFVMHIFVRMTIHIHMVFCQCTFLYKWLSVFFLNGF